MKKVLFIDRDGTIIKEPPDGQVDNIEKLQFLPGVITALSKIVNETDYSLVMITNQDGTGTESFPEKTFRPVHNLIIRILSNEGVIFDEIFIDRTFPEDISHTRKSGTAMLTRYIAQGVDLNSSFVIGNSETDLELAENLGCRTILINNRSQSGALFITNDWNDIYVFLKNMPRTARIERNTLETSVIVELNLDGSGKSDTNTGISFLDHMLDQIARHGEIDLMIKAKGDLDCDAHHTIEDVAIALGQGFLKALGSKKGIERYGFLLPMDDCLAQVAIDFGGRSWLVWDVEFVQEKTGDMPTEMFCHFFKSFSDQAKCNLNIKAEGKNEHHKAEAIFKAFAKAVKMAVTKTGSYNLPTTKGKL